MRGKSKGVALAILLGVTCVYSVGAEATTGRGSREATKQPRVTLQQASVRSVKPQDIKAQPLRREAALSLSPGATGISCVPYVRAVTGMEISGNAHAWWGAAAGVYARGYRPEPGSVLSFKSSGGMRLGHVAVVSRIVGPREVLIDHANWEGPGIRKGTVMRGVSVIDTSDRNDWTSVRVQVGRSDEAYGRVYPANGFIYNRPAGTMMAKGSRFEEVAEAPASPHAGHLADALQDLNLNAVTPR